MASIPISALRAGASSSSWWGRRDIGRELSLRARSGVQGGGLWQGLGRRAGAGAGLISRQNVKHCVKALDRLLRLTFPLFPWPLGLGRGAAPGIAAASCPLPLPIIAITLVIAFALPLRCGCWPVVQRPAPCRKCGCRRVPWYRQRTVPPMWALLPAVLPPGLALKAQQTPQPVQTVAPQSAQ